jgi:hypothetical protein
MHGGQATYEVVVDEDLPVAVDDVRSARNILHPFAKPAALQTGMEPLQPPILLLGVCALIGSWGSERRGFNEQMARQRLYATFKIQMRPTLPISFLVVVVLGET